MRVIVHPSFISKQDQGGNDISLVAVGTGSTLFLISQLIPFPLGFFLKGCALFGFMVSLAALLAVSPWTKGEADERRTLNAVAGLSDDYIAIRNWSVPGTQQGDIDLLVIGSHGVLVIEVKNFSARYECDGDTWMNVKPNGYRMRIKSPSIQLKRNTKAVQTYLRGQGWMGPVNGVLVLPDRE